MREDAKTGRVLHTGQAIVDIVMEVSVIPEAGADTYARDSHITAGGGFNVMAAAARDGAEVVYLGAVGDGPFGEVVSRALSGEGVLVPAEPIQGVDTGYCVAIVEDSAERTFVSYLGAEGRSSLANLTAVAPTPADVVYVTGYSLLHACNRQALLEWLPVLSSGVRVVFDPAPLIDEVPDDAFGLLVEHAWLWTVNAREAGLILQRLGVAQSFGAASSDAATALAGALGRPVLLRAGGEGSYFCEPDAAPAHVPALPVTPVDTNGAGDAHTGVLMAHLARGGELLDGARRANVAAAIAVTRRGPATSPGPEEIDRALKVVPRL